MKRIFPFVILLCAISFVCPSIGSAQSLEEGIAIFKQAEELQKKARSIEDVENALNKYEKALKIFQVVGSEREAGVTLNNSGLIYDSLGQYDKALECHEKSLSIRRRIGHVGGEAVTLSNLGRVYMSLGQYQKALEYYEESLAIRKKSGDVAGEGTPLVGIGLVYRSLGQYQKALEFHEKSLAIRQRIGDVKGEGDSLNNIGLVYDSLGEYQKALEYYEKSLVIARKMGDVGGEGITLNNIAGIHNSLGEYQKTMQYLEKSLVITRKIGDVAQEGVTLNNIGNVYDSLRQYQRALEYCEASLSIKRNIGDFNGEGITLNNIAAVYESLGQYSKALDYYEKSLFIASKTGDVEQEGVILGNIGRVHKSSGQYEKALEYSGKALDIMQKIGNVKRAGLTLDNIAAVYESLGQYSKALDCYEKALALKKKIGVPYDMTEDSIGNVYLTMGDVQGAEPILKKANQWDSLGRLALVKSDFNDAKIKFTFELNFALQNRKADSLFTAHTGLGLAYEGLNQFDKAAEHFKEAITLTEQIRDTLTPAQRSNFYDAQIRHIPRVTPYEGLARVLLQSGKPGQSFKEAEGTKARIFAESLSGRSQDIVPYVPKQIIEQDLAINNKVAAFSQGLQKAYEKASKDAIESFEKELKDARSEKDRHVDMLRKDFPLYAATKYPQPMNLEHSALNDDEWVLEYEVTEPGVCIYLTRGKHIIKATFKPIARQELDGMVRKFLTPMQLRSGESLPKKLTAFDFASGKKLSDLLLGDILSELPKDTPLIIVPDDSLGVIPFEMLTLNQTGKITTDGKMPKTSGADFFGDRNPISYYQSVTALTLARTLGNRKQIGDRTIAMVDPVFTADDTRLLKYAKTDQEKLASSVPKDLLMSIESANSITFQRIKLTAQLGDSLKNADPSRTDLYQGMDAKKSVILEKDLSPYRSVVFATHGYFGKDLPGIQEPVLVLTLLDQPEAQDGFLRMSEVMGLNINCDLAALTACQTGLGKQISGEGTMGMGRAFQYAGARSVLMSLWSVHEVASMNLIKSFFRNMKEGKNKSDALAAARSEIRKNGFDHPFFWAGFILVGEPQ
jgi:tetratricopeptide (TPR) repeat protein